MADGGAPTALTSGGFALATMYLLRTTGIVLSCAPNHASALACNTSTRIYVSAYAILCINGKPPPPPSLYNPCLLYPIPPGTQPNTPSSQSIAYFQVSAPPPGPCSYYKGTSRCDTAGGLRICKKKYIYIFALPELCRDGLLNLVATMATTSRLSFLQIPPELHLEIASHLPICDVNSLLQTNSYFFALLDKPLHQRVARIAPPASTDLDFEEADDDDDDDDNNNKSSRPLHRIIALDRNSVLTRLLSLGFSPSPQFVHSAIHFGKHSMVRTLLDAGVPLEGERTTLLHVACWDGGAWGSDVCWRRDGQLEMVELLLDYGADVNAADAKGRPPLSYAWSGEVWPLVGLLLQRGADPGEAVGTDGIMRVGGWRR
ncbi:ankyrin repeat-containing domain protein [Sphaerosporella brunnea]|uniref:Ankyrin repeat-containing domain protein n=1 Tax=Sphaerosporella brunnea TaxID=1250544 RepID=A0A5J5EM17_9PEZI|nr:ankyrin repeat-containing domain protein [Sphaerosporella brunnea]